MGMLSKRQVKELAKRQVKELVLYPPQHVARLEKAGQFPRRVHLGPARVGWVEDEILDWLSSKLKRRVEDEQRAIALEREYTERRRDASTNDREGPERDPRAR